MFDWFRRYVQRQRDLAAGADADLIASNWKRSKLGILLFGAGFLLISASGAKQVHGIAKEVLLWVGGVPMLVGFGMLIWSRQERAFLAKPDSKKPPSLFK
jgi:hypothetical protein